jgi:hemerythrin-like domain-containing protein
MFSFLDERFPELAPALERLRQEHQALARLLGGLQDLISAERTDPTAVLTEVERLTAELEAHLDYEEEQLIPVLDKVTP